MQPEQWLAMGWTMSIYLLWLLVTDRMQSEQWLAMGWTMSVYLLWLLVTDRLQSEQWLAMGWTMWDSNPGGGKIFPYPTRLAPRHTQHTVQWVPGLFPRGEVAGMWHWPHHPLLMLRMSAGSVICVPPLSACLACYKTTFYLFCCYQKHLISSKWISLAAVDRTKLKPQNEIYWLKYKQRVKHQTLHSHTSHSSPFFTLFAWSWPNHHTHTMSNFN